VEVECAVASDDLGPQALWNDVCQQLAPGRRLFVPGGLFSGLREPNVATELQRLYAILDDVRELSPSPPPPPPPPPPRVAPYAGSRG
jgi:hypothetical protein